MKTKGLFYGFVVSLILLLAIANNAVAATPVSGIIDSDTTWTLAGSPYIITGSVLVMEGATLTIDPGVEVRFDGSYRLQIEGQLIAIGTASNLIRFTSNLTPQQVGDWIGIIFTDSSVDASFDADGSYASGSTIQFSEITYGGTALAYYSSPFISNNRFAYNSPKSNPYPGYYPWDSAVLTYYGSSNPLITRNVIDNNNGSAIMLSANSTNPLVSENIIYNNVGNNWASGITDFGSNATVSNNVVASNQGGEFPGGFFVYGGNPVVERNSFVDNTSTSSWDDRGGGAIGSWSETLTVQQNTITRNGGSSTIHLNRIGTGIVLTQNNIVSNTATYDIYVSSYALSTTYTPPIDATDDYWGTTDSTVVTSRIFNAFDEFGRELVAINPLASTPIYAAPMMPPLDVIAVGKGNSITVSWMANTEADTAGYKVYWGTTFGFPYANVVDVLNVTSYTITALAPGIHYVTVTAYDNDYDPANDDVDTIVNENQTNGNESWYGTECTVPVEMCEGDFDRDGDVDGSDLAVFAADFGRSDCAGNCEGDFDDDGDVDGSDLAVFAADYGRTDCPVPEE